MKITISNGTAKVYTPYNSDFVAKLKKSIGGARWNSADRCWEVNESSVESVRQIMIDVFGESDIPDASGAVTLKISVSAPLYGYRESVSLFGKTIARAYGRDSGAKPGNDVVFVEGHPTSGGSAKNWETIVPAGCIINLHNVPRAMYDRYISQPDNDAITVEIVEDTTVNREALIDERESLLKRIAEIDAILGDA